MHSASDSSLIVLVLRCSVFEVQCQHPASGCASGVLVGFVRPPDLQEMGNATALRLS